MSVTTDMIAAQYRKCGLPVPPGVLPAAQPRPSRPQPAVGTADVLALSVTLPIRTVSEANTRAGASSHMARVKAQRSAVRERLRSMAAHLPAMPVVVTLTRIGRRLLDTDNLGSALKAVRDGVADCYGVDDGAGERDGAYVWQVGQRPCRTGYAVEIKVESAGGVG